MIPLLLSLLIPMQTAGAPAPGPEAEAPEELRLTIFHTGAFHSSLEKAAAVARVVKEERAKGKRVLLLDSGNHVDPSRLETHATQGAIDIEMMNLMGYDAMALGHGEIYFGGDAHARVFRQAGFPVLSSNLERVGSEDPLAVPYWTPLGDLDGLRVGIIGVTSLAGAGPKPRARIEEWCRASDPSSAAKRYADLLQGRVDVVIVLSNASMATNRNLQPHPTVDLVIGGYHEAPLRQPSHMRGYCVWAPEEGYLGKLECVFRREPRVFSVEGYEAIPLGGEGDAEVAQHLDGWKKQIIEGKWDAEVGESAADLPPRRTADIVADALRRDRTEVAFCDTRALARPLGKGPITRQDLWALLPRGGQVVTFTLPGSRLRSLVEQGLVGGGGLRFSGLTYEYDPTLPEGAQVVSLRIGRAELRDERPYGCAADELTLGLLGLLGELSEAKDSGETAVSAVVEHVGAQAGPIAAREDGRVTRRVPEEAAR